MRPHHTITYLSASLESTSEMPTPQRLQHSPNLCKNQHLASQALVNLSLVGPGWDRWPLYVPPGRGCWQHTPEAGTALLWLAHLQLTLGTSQEESC